MTQLPPRVWIVGTCGSGKSFVADMLAERLGLPAIHLDETHWNPGWIESAPDDELRIVGDLLDRHDRGWVVDGNYDQIREVFADQADLFIWLDLPFYVTSSRLLYRSVTRAFTREIVCNGNRESLLETFGTKRSILLWAIQMHRWRRRTLAEDLDGRTHMCLRSAREVERWLAQLGHASRPST